MSPAHAPSHTFHQGGGSIHLNQWAASADGSKKEVARGQQTDWEEAMNKLVLFGVALSAALLSAAPVSLHWSPAKPVFVSIDKAEARLGRPLTPLSAAGVNRRVHRRAYYGAAVGAGAAGAYYHGARCGYAPYPPCY
jgi:hypothetical protein